MKKLELDIKANDPEWLYIEYQTKLRGMKDIAVECNTTQDSIRTRLKKFDIPIRSHKEALEIRNTKYPFYINKEIRDRTNLKKRAGIYIKCANCGIEIYVNQKSKRKFCSKSCLTNFRKENINRDQDWRDWPEYNKWRDLVYYRDAYKCQICGSKEKINAHHIFEASFFPDKRFDVDNGIVLCKKHHIQVHSPSSKELLEKNPNFGGSPEVDNPEASLREYLISLLRSND